MGSPPKKHPMPTFGPLDPNDPPRRPTKRRAGITATAPAVATPVRAHTTRRILLILAGFILSAAIGAGTYFLPLATTAAQDFGSRPTITTHGTPNSATSSAPLPGNGQPFTILLLGSDNDAKFVADHILTQSMILVRVDPATHQATIISLPRDLWVPLANGGSAKIDAAYANGGPSNAIATVEQDFNVHIDYYAWVGLEGLVNIVQEMGGTDMVTEMPVLDDDYPADLTGANPYSYQRIAILPGPQYLDGTTALDYARSRHGDILEDIARSQKQQELLVDLKNSAKSLSITDLPSLATALGTGFHTDMSVTQVSSMVPLANELTGPNLHTIVMNYAPYFSSGVINGQDVLIPDWTAIDALVSQYFPS